MEFRILGPVEAGEDGRAVSLGGRKQRTVLAVLVLHANEVVSSHRLIELLWGEDPLPTAPKALQGHVAGLRKALGPEAIVTRSPGYVLVSESDQIDLGRFERLRREARSALDDGEPGKAAERLRAALDLWRGDPLGDVGFEPSVQAEVARLEGLRLGALEERIDADIAMGRSTELVDELEHLVATNPLRERLWGDLMLSLYLSGRQADALDAYRRARQTLVAELGIEPGPGLRDLESRILAQDPALEPERPAPAREPGHAPPDEEPPARVRRWAILLAAAAAVGAVIVAVLLLTGGDSDSVSVPPDSAVVIDPARDQVVGAIELPSIPGATSAGAGGLWVLSAESSTLSQIDPRARRLV